MKRFGLVSLFLAFLASPSFGSTADQDLDRVELTVRLEVNGKLVLEKRVSPRFGEKRTLTKTFYDAKTEYELELLPSRYNDNAALVEASITKITDLGPSKRRSTLLGTPKIVTLNKIDASAEASGNGTRYKLSVLPTFHDL